MLLQNAQQNKENQKLMQQKMGSGPSMGRNTSMGHTMNSK
jgi:hypothetical protein